MSTLQVANLNFEATANNQLVYNGSNTIVIRIGGANVASLNVSTLSFSTNLSANIYSVNTVSDQYGNIRNLPVANQTASYVLANSDSGRAISTNSGITVNGALIGVGSIFTIYNNSAASITITQGTGTMYLSGTATTGNRTLAQKGLVTLLCVDANTFVISGSGVT